MAEGIPIIRACEICLQKRGIILVGNTPIMLMKKQLLFAICVITLWQTAPALAILQAYWNMDANNRTGKETVNQGAQSSTASAFFFEDSAGFFDEIQYDISGTTDNILPPSPPTNRSVGFFRLASVYYDGGFQMDNFDFTGLTDVEVSFAYRSLNAFTWDTELEVDYRINNGSWVDFNEGQSWSSGWQTATIGFGSALDGQSDVDLRIRSINWGTAIGWLDVDNVQVNAVPEPQVYAMLIAGAALGLALWRRHRRA